MELWALKLLRPMIKVYSGRSLYDCFIMTQFIFEIVFNLYGDLPCVPTPEKDLYRSGISFRQLHFGEDLVTT